MAAVQREVALVTGGGSGIGRAICLNQAARGIPVAVVDIDEATARDVAREARIAGSPFSIAIQSDIRNEDDVRRAFETCRGQLGVPTRIVANAGIEIVRLAHETRLDEWDRVIGTNLTGTFITCRAGISLLLEAKQAGSVVCVSSPSAFVGFAAGSNSAYGSSKGGISALIRALAIDYAGDGIRVNAVVPGATDTPILSVTTHDTGQSPFELAKTQIPLGRLARPDEIADAVDWLLGPHSSYVTGSHVFVDGGLTARGANDF